MYGHMYKSKNLQFCFDFANCMKTIYHLVMLPEYTDEKPARTNRLGFPRVSKMIHVTVWLFLQLFACYTCFLSLSGWLEETASDHRVKRQEYARENQRVLKEKARFTMKPVTAAQSAVNEILKKLNSYDGLCQRIANQGSWVESRQLPAFDATEE